MVTLPPTDQELHQASVVAGDLAGVQTQCKSAQLRDPRQAIRGNLVGPSAHTANFVGYVQKLGHEQGRQEDVAAPSGNDMGQNGKFMGPITPPTPPSQGEQTTWLAMPRA